MYVAQMREHELLSSTIIGKHASQAEKVAAQHGAMLCLVLYVAVHP